MKGQTIVKKWGKGVLILIVIVLAAVIVFGVLKLNSPSDSSKTDYFYEDNTSGSSDSENSGDSQTYNVEIKGFAYSPSEISVNVGDTVVWANLDSAEHTITSDSGSELDSELLSNGGAYSHTFNSAGTFDYHCTPHPSITGKVIVE